VGLGAHAYFRVGEFAVALEQAALWLEDQPFSSRPVVTASFICSAVFDDHHRAMDFCMQGLRANPGDPTLENNMAFSLACAGDLDAAEGALKRISSGASEDNRAPVLATRGLIAYRRGNTTEGSRLYSDAYQFARRQRDRDIRALVLLNWAREDLLSGSPSAPIVELVRRETPSDSAEYIRLLERKVLQLAATGLWPVGDPAAKPSAR